MQDACSSKENIPDFQESVMPYVIGWLLGAPLALLVIIYLVFRQKA